MNDKKVIEICGDYPEDFIKEDILSNPNFIFNNDTAYSAVKVWDVEGNSVFVNSFQECEHYVTGGWDMTPNQDREYFLQNFLLLGVLFFVLVKYFLNKKSLSDKNEQFN
tara:strand:- start:430 stop:756 length:327 start_codon:yes stop_codon:yes gene_type:complete